MSWCTVTIKWRFTMLNKLIESNVKTLALQPHDIIVPWEAHWLIAAAAADMSAPCQLESGFDSGINLLLRDYKSMTCGQRRQLTSGQVSGDQWHSRDSESCQKVCLSCQRLSVSDSTAGSEGFVSVLGVATAPGSDMFPLVPLSPLASRWDAARCRDYSRTCRRFCNMSYVSRRLRWQHLPARVRLNLLSPCATNTLVFRFNWSLEQVSL